MDKFIVSARKYRPQNFNTVVGQSHITTTLKNAIKNNQLAHAFLFCGPRGVGKTTCARILAKTINCEKPTKDSEACNKCQSCISFDSGTSLNIHELDAASNNSVDDIRSLTEQVRFAPQAGKYKVYIVDEVHMLSAAAFNAFLKTLEEPPPYAIFILATTEKHKILPTILSRCQIFDFKRITAADTVEHLQEICTKEDIKADKTALHVIAQKSEGCMRDSLSILDKIVSFTNGDVTYANTLLHLNILDEDYYFKLLQSLKDQDASNALLMFDEINKKGFEGDTVLNGFSEFLRNVLVSSDAKVAMLLEVAEDFKQKYLQTAQSTSIEYIINALGILSDAEVTYKQARNKRLHVELTIIKLCYLQQALELVDTNITSKKKVAEGNKVVAFKALPIIRLKQQQDQLFVSQQKTTIVTSEAKLIIEEPAAEKLLQKNIVAEPTIEEKKPTGLAALKKLREKVAEQNKAATNETITITTEALNKVWDDYIDKLKANNNHSAVTNFKGATLHYEGDNLIEITVGGDIQKKFIETERASLIEYFQNSFRNKLLKYVVIIAAASNDESHPQEKILNKKQLYLKLIEEYPLVKELKDRLKLELDI